MGTVNYQQALLYWMSKATVSFLWFRFHIIQIKHVMDTLTIKNKAKSSDIKTEDVDWQKTINSMSHLSSKHAKPLLKVPAF